MVSVKTDAYKSIVVESKDGELTISEGMKVKFCNEIDGEVVRGNLVKISGKGEKTKLQIIPYGAQKQELWDLAVIADSSLDIDNE